MNRSVFLLWTGVAALPGCPRQTQPAPVASAVGGTLIQAQVPVGPGAATGQVSQVPTEWDGMVAAVDREKPQALACYQAALARNPQAYGEILVRVVVDGEGRARDAAMVLDTVGDDILVSCIEGLVRAVQFPIPSGPGVTGRYPFVFTSDLTPPEVVRTLQSRVGALPPEPPPSDPLQLKDVPPTPGTVETW